MNTKIQTIHFANNGTDAADVGFDFLDADGQPVKPARSQFTLSSGLVAALLAECQAHVDGTLADVTDATRATSLVKAMKELDDTRAAVVIAKAEQDALVPK